jgi:hypothetical protein
MSVEASCCLLKNVVRRFQHKLGTEDISKPKFGDNSVYGTSNGNWAGVKEISLPRVRKSHITTLINTDYCLLVCIAL